MLLILLSIFSKIKIFANLSKNFRVLVSLKNPNYRYNTSPLLWIHLLHSKLLNCFTCTEKVSIPSSLNCMLLKRFQDICLIRSAVTRHALITAVRAFYLSGLSGCLCSSSHIQGLILC